MFTNLRNILAVALLGCALPALAGTTYTSAASGDWAVSTNWSPNGVPGATDDAVVRHAMNLSGGADCSTLIFDASAASISGAFQLTIQAGAINVSGTGSHTLDCNVAAFSNPLTITQNSSGVFTINGVYSGPIGLIKNGSGVLRLAGNNTYPGGTSLHNGAIEIGHDNALSNGALQVDAGTTVAAFGGARTVNVPLIMNGDFTVNGSQNLTFAQPINLGNASRTFTVNNTLTTAAAGIRCPAARSAPVSGINNGTSLNLSAPFPGDLGSPTQYRYERAGTGSITSSGTALTCDAAGFTGVLPGDLIRSGPETQVVLAVGGSMNLTTLQPFSSPLTNASFAIQKVGAGTITSSGTSVTGNSTTFGSDVFSGDVLYEISAVADFTKAGTGTLELGGFSTFTGSTIVSAGTLRAKASGVFPAGSLLQVFSTATFDMNGFDQMVRSLTDSGAVLLGSGTLSVGSLNANYSFTGSMSGSGGLALYGGGTLVLGGAQKTFTGPVNIHGGTLQNGNSGVLPNATQMTIDNGGTYLLADHDQMIGSLSGDGIVDLGSGSTTVLTVGDANNTTFNGQIQGNGGITKQGSGTLTLGGMNGMSGASSVAAGILEITHYGAIQNCSTVAVQSGARLTVSGAAMDARLSGVNVQNGGTLELAAMQGSTTNGSVPSAPIQGTLEVNAMVGAEFNGVQMAGSSTMRLLMGSGNYGGTVTLNGACTFDMPTAIMFHFNGAISGSGGITKTGPGDLEFAGANSFTGPLTVSGGTVHAGINGGFSSSTALTVDNGCTFDANMYVSLFSSLNGHGTVTSSSGADISVGYNDSTFTFFGKLTGGGGLSKAGNGTFTLNPQHGANDYSGPTNITLGTLQNGAADALSAISDVIVHSGATYNLNGLTQTIGALGDGGAGDAGSVTLGAGTLAIGGNDGNGTFNGVISGTGGIQKIGGGMQEFTTGPSTYSGGTVLSVGELDISGTSGAGFGPIGTGVLVIEGGTHITAPSVSSTLNNAVKITGDFSMGSGVPQLNLAGPVSLEGATRVISITGTNQISGVISSGPIQTATVANITDDATLAVDVAFTLDLPGGTKFTFDRTCSGAVSSSGTTVNGTSTAFASELAVGDTLRAAGQIRTVAAISNDLTLSVDSAFSPALSGASLVRERLATGSINSSGTEVYGTGTLLSTELANGDVIHPKSAGLTVQSGTLVLSGANTYNGHTSIASTGAIQNGADNVIPDESDVLVDYSATYDTNVYNETIGSLSGNGYVYLSTGAANTLTIGASNESGGFYGSMGGTGNLVKIGTGTQELGMLSGSYTGTATIKSGVLAINGNLSANPIILDGGTLGGTGSTGVISVASGGKVSPGSPIASPGILTGNDLALNSSVTFSVNLNGAVTAGTDYDQFVMGTAGSLDLGGSNLEIVVANGYTPTAANPGDSYVIIDNPIGDAPAISTFGNLPSEGSQMLVVPVGGTPGANSMVFQISYVAGSSFKGVALTRWLSVPTITSSLLPQVVQPEANFNYTLTADVLCVLTAKSLPAWMSFDSATGVLSGQPTAADIGDSYIELKAENADGNDTKYMTVHVPPGNDNFANAYVLTGFPVSTTGVNMGATLEAGEPAAYAGVTNGASVWWKWTAPANQDVIVSTSGSDFDTLLSIFTGSDVTSLALVADNDNFGAGQLSELTFSAVGGTTYMIVVDGSYGATGPISLGISEAAAPVITSPLVASYAARTDFTYTITASNGPMGFGAQMTLTGSVDAIPTPTTTSFASSTLMGVTGLAGHNVTFTSGVNNGASVFVSDLNPSSGEVMLGAQLAAPPAAGDTFQFSGLPSGWSLDPVKGNLSGSYGAEGTLSVFLSAENISGFGNATLTLKFRGDPPTISTIADQTIPQDTSTGGLSFTIGDTETPATSLQVSGFAADSTLVPPSGIVFGGSGTNRTITITPAPGMVGTTMVDLHVTDQVDQVAGLHFNLTVNPVNHAPSFTKGADQSVQQGCGPQTVSNWATKFVPGPATESSQKVKAYIVSNNNSALFKVQPAVAPDGTLTYTPADDANGSATVSVQVQDDGGTANGGVDTSAAQTFTISVSVGGTLAVITSADTASGQVGADFLYTITATGSQPIKFSCSALPAGLSLVGDTITGTPEAIGVTDVILTAANGWKPDGTLKLTISISTAPLAITSALTANAKVGLGFSYEIKASGDGPFTFSATGLPDGLTFAGATISGVPKKVGDVRITISATGPDGAKDTQSLALKILDKNANLPPLVSEIVACPLPAVVGDSIGFYVTTEDPEGHSVALSWDFGDGATATGSDPEHTFAAAGQYTVSLSASDGTNKTTQSLQVSVYTLDPNAPDIRNVTIAPNPALKGDPVTFTAQIVDPNNVTATASWNFGDGTPVVTGNTVQHTFADVGHYAITLGVTNANGLAGRPVGIQAFVIAAQGSKNVNDGTTTDNPLNGLSIGIDNSTDGIVAFEIDVDALNRSAFDVDTDFGIAGRGPVRGTHPVAQYKNEGIFIATTTAKDIVTHEKKGRARKTVPISAREIGQPGEAKTDPPTKTIIVDSIKGNFLFGRSGGATLAKPDTLSLTGRIAIPDGVDFTKPKQVHFAVGNVVDSAVVSAKGDAAGKVSKIRIKPKKNKDKTRSATFTIKLTQTDLTNKGFDTEGVNPNPKSADLRIQTAIVLGGNAYSVDVPVKLKIDKDGGSGTIFGRTGGE
ncbi:MAG TPA: autotransporter-associated beta strand repeat-containing protein [Planctomycetota bacterium]